MPTSAAAETDLGVEKDTCSTAAAADCPTPPGMTKEQFEKNYPSVAATFTLTMAGQNILCHYVDGKCFVVSDSTTRMVGIAATNPSPIFLYAGGSWIGDTAKAKC